MLDLVAPLRVDRACGVFETMLVRDGRVVRLHEHLARLRHSVRSLYDVELVEDALINEVRRFAAQIAPALPTGIKTIARPEPLGRVEVTTCLRPLTDRQLPIRLEPVAVEGGLGPHKWVDRAWLEFASRSRHTPLLVDGHNHALEAAWGNLFAVVDNVLCTPPTDGSILPGITRATLLERARAQGMSTAEQPLTMQALRAADALFVTSALAGAVPAVLPGSAGVPDGAHAARLADLLAQD